MCLQGGFSAGEMIDNVRGIDAERRRRLIKVLDIDRDWQMNRVSDGQRRRVQICMGLLRPFRVITVTPAIAMWDLHFMPMTFQPVLRSCGGMQGARARRSNR